MRDTPIGPVQLEAGPNGLTHLRLGVASADGPCHDSPQAAARVLEQAKRQLAQYFAGTRRVFDLALDLRGTPFQVSVWRALAEVPYGATVSYGEIAQRIGRPTAVRAVGAANGANPIVIIVPCHRVVGSDGRLTGYGGGLSIKRRLLTHEGVGLRQDRVVPPASSSEGAFQTTFDYGRGPKA